MSPALPAALFLLLPSVLYAAPSASIHYFDHEYRVSLDLSNSVEEIADSTAAHKLDKVTNAFTYTNGAKFVIDAPGSLSAAELNRTTNFALESQDKPGIRTAGRTDGHRSPAPGRRWRRAFLHSQSLARPG